MRFLYPRKDNRAHCWYRTPVESTVPFLGFIAVWVNLLIFAQATADMEGSYTYPSTTDGEE